MNLNYDQAVDTAVRFADGSQERLSDLWRNQPLVLVFLRHLGWTFCRQQVAQLRRKAGDFDQAGARIILVGMGTVEQSAAYAAKQELPFPLIADPECDLYQHFRLEKISYLEMLSTSLAAKFLSALAGYGISRWIGDVRQLPGVFVIDTQGRIVYSHRGNDPADHPKPDTILGGLRAAGWPYPRFSLDRNKRQLDSGEMELPEDSITCWLNREEIGAER